MSYNWYKKPKDHCLSSLAKYEDISQQHHLSMLNCCCGWTNSCPVVLQNCSWYPDPQFKTQVWVRLVDLDHFFQHCWYCFLYALSNSVSVLKVYVFLSNIWWLVGASPAQVTLLENTSTTLCDAKTVWCVLCHCNVDGEQGNTRYWKEKHELWRQALTCESTSGKKDLQSCTELSGSTALTETWVLNRASRTSRSNLRDFCTWTGSPTAAASIFI